MTFRAAKKPLKQVFRDAFLGVVCGPFTHTHGLMWNTYQTVLKNIDPNDLPPKLRKKFTDLKDLMEAKVDKQVQRRLRRPEYVRPGDEPPTVEQVRERIVSGRDYLHFPLNSMSHAHGKQFKETLFEIYEALPKTVRKPRQKKGEEPKKEVELLVMDSPLVTYPEES